MDKVSKVCAVYDIPYEFKDDKGNMRSGFTRKAAIAEFDDEHSAVVTSLYVAKCAPDCELQVGNTCFLDYDKYGRVRGSRPFKK